MSNCSGDSFVGIKVSGISRWGTARWGPGNMSIEVKSETRWSRHGRRPMYLVSLRSLKEQIARVSII